MKVAVAFFGIPRASDVCFPSIEKMILDQIPDHAETQIFYHLYKQNTVVNSRSNENGELTEDDYAPFAAFKGRLDKPNECLDKWDFEAIKAHGDFWNDDFASLRNLVHQLNSLYEVTQMVKSTNPDVVIFVRPDLLYHTPINPKHISFAYKYSNTAFIPAWQWFRGINDRFTVCGKDIFSAYGERILEIQDYLAHHDNPLHSEDLLKYTLKKHRALIMPLCVNASRVRVGGAVREESFKFFKKTGGKRSTTKLLLKRIWFYLFKLLA